MYDICTQRERARKTTKSFASSLVVYFNVEIKIHTCLLHALLSFIADSAGLHPRGARASLEADTCARGG